MVFTGNRAYALVKDDPKLVKQVLKSTIDDPNLLIEVIINDPVYASRGITREVIEDMVWNNSMPPLKDYWSRNDSPEMRTIENELDTLFEHMDDLFEMAKKTRERDKLAEEIGEVREEIDRLQGQKKALTQQELVGTALYDGTPGLLQQILQGAKTPAVKYDAVRPLPFEGGRPTGAPRGSSRGGGGGALRPAVPVASASFNLVGGRPLVEAWKQRLAGATDRRERDRLMGTIRRLRRGEAAPAAPIFAAT